MEKEEKTLNHDWQTMVYRLQAKGVLKKERILKAFQAIDRADFLPEHKKDLAYLNEPLEIGKGQTISQPYTVAFMLDLLNPEPGQKILDIGAGSGWQSALLAHIVGKEGKVYAVEILPELCEFGKNNLKKYKFIEEGRIEWFCQDASKGLPEKAPFNKIIAAASLDTGVPKEWFEQLSGIGASVVAPVKHSIWHYALGRHGNLSTSKEYSGFVFVPFKES